MLEVGKKGVSVETGKEALSVFLKHGERASSLTGLAGKDFYDKYLGLVAAQIPEGMKSNFAVLFENSSASVAGK